MNAPNAKTGAAVRKQAPIVAHNIIKDINKSSDEYRLTMDMELVL